MDPPEIDSFRNKVDECVLIDSSNGVGSVTGIYVDVFRVFRFRNKNASDHHLCSVYYFGH